MGRPTQGWGSARRWARPSRCKGCRSRTANLGKLAFIVAASANRSAFEEGPGDVSRLTYLVAQAEVRYGLNSWLGLMGGYDYRNVDYEGAGEQPPFVRHVVFFGLSGFWSTNHTLPTLDTFVSPVDSARLTRRFWARPLVPAEVAGAAGRTQPTRAKRAEYVTTASASEAPLLLDRVSSRTPVVRRQSLPSHLARSARPERGDAPLLAPPPPPAEGVVGLGAHRSEGGRSEGARA